MKLSDTQFETIDAAVQCPDLSPWVIVKEYIPEATNASHVQEIHTRFNIAKRARILPKDVRVENYRGPQIVDLSTTLTAPCPGWSEFEFKFFYEETVYGVFNWFGSQPESQPIQPRWTTSEFLLASTFALVLCVSWISSRTRLPRRL